MLDNLPSYVTITFVLTTLATLILFTWAIRNAKTETTQKKSTIISVCLLAWLAILAVVSLNNFYTTGTGSFPPRIMLLGVLPAMLIIVILFVTPGGRKFMDELPLKQLTWLHTVRIPVEIVLYWLFLYKYIPQLMTFEGRNFDILAGLSAPFIAYFAFTRQVLKRNAILIWNFICLGLLLNIVVNASLSTPSTFQEFAFEQPNVAILYFPFSWLPAFIVPLVLFSHLVSIRQLLKGNTGKSVPH